MKEFMKAVWPALMLFTLIGCAPKEAPQAESSLESPSLYVSRRCAKLASVQPHNLTSRMSVARWVSPAPSAL